MKAFNLVALNMKGKPAKKSTDVISYKEPTLSLSVVVLADKLQLTTSKGCYNLVKHPHLSQYEATLGKYKVRATVKDLTCKVWYW